MQFLSQRLFAPGCAASPLLHAGFSVAVVSGAALRCVHSGSSRWGTRASVGAARGRSSAGLAVVA